MPLFLYCYLSWMLLPTTYGREERVIKACWTGLSGFSTGWFYLVLRHYIRKMPHTFT
jgi:hypothetical protein